MDYQLSYVFDTIFYKINTKINVKLWGNKKSTKKPYFEKIASHFSKGN